MLIPTLMLLATPAYDTTVFHLHTGVPHQEVYLAASFYGWDAHVAELRLAEISPGDYRLELDAPWLPSILYKFVADGKWLSDPENPEQEADGHGGFNSRRDFPDFSADPLLSPSSEAPWRRTDLELTDLSGAARTISVIEPLRRRRGQRSAAVYFQDGGDYLDRTGAANLLARLSRDPRLPRLVGIFIPPRDRLAEYTLSDEGERYVRFVTERVVPEVEARFPAGGSPADRLLIGASLGGLITIHTALRRGDVFSQAASQSGSFWWGDERILPELEASAGAGLKLFLEVGRYESPTMTACNRKARDLALGAGHQLHYQELPTIHDWIDWEERLNPLLRYFFARDLVQD